MRRNSYYMNKKLYHQCIVTFWSYTYEICNQLYEVIEFRVILEIFALMSV